MRLDTEMMGARFLSTYREKLRRIGKWVTLVAGLLAAVWFAIFMYTAFIFLHSPLSPNRDSGNVVPWSNHGVVHYVTTFDDSLQSGLWTAGLTIIALEFVGLALYRGRHMFDRR